MKTKGKGGSNYTLHTILDLELARNHFGLHWFIHGIGKKGLLKAEVFMFFLFLFFFCSANQRNGFYEIAAYVITELRF